MTHNTDTTPKTRLRYYHFNTKNRIVDETAMIRIGKRTRATGHAINRMYQRELILDANDRNGLVQIMTIAANGKPVATTKDRTTRRGTIAGWTVDVIVTHGNILITVLTQPTPNAYI